MERYRRIRDRLRRPYAAAFFAVAVGVFLLVEAIWLGRGGAAYFTIVAILVGAVVQWLVPAGRKLHPPSESTLQWARKQRRKAS